MSGTPVTIFDTNGGIIVCTIVFTRTRTADGIVITVTFVGGTVTAGWCDARLMSGRA